VSGQRQRVAEREDRGRRRSACRPLAAGAFAAAVLASGCSPGLGDTLRRHTYSPEFNYLSQEQLETTMGRFARLLTQLNAIMAADAEIDAAERERIVALLRGLEAESRALGPGGWPSNHPQITAHVGAFRRDVERARLAAEREPPNYFWAGSISAACSYCHSARR
jgi:uncharacterized membrane protein YebE (DUF533 family)